MLTRVELTAKIYWDPPLLAREQPRRDRGATAVPTVTSTRGKGARPDSVAEIDEKLNQKWVHFWDVSQGRWETTKGLGSKGLGSRIEVKD
jgi:hypothetical protein